MLLGQSESILSFIEIIYLHGSNFHGSMKNCNFIGSLIYDLSRNDIYILVSNSFIHLLISYLLTCKFMGHSPPPLPPKKKPNEN